MWCGSLKSGRERLKSVDGFGNSKEEIRILIIGSPGVGKTTICRSFSSKCPLNGLEPKLSTAELGVCGVYDKWDTVDAETCYLTILDVNIAPKVRSTVGSDVTISQKGDVIDSTTKPFLQGVDGIVLVYSVIDRASLKAIDPMLKLVQQARNVRGTPVVLVGNKTDLRSHREVRTSEGREYAFDIGSSFYEISTRYSKYEIDCVFFDIIRQVRCVRYRAKVQERSIVNVGGLIRKLSLRTRRRNFKRQNSAST